MPVRRIYADISELFHGAETLVLDDDASAGASTITVKNITGAAINNILFFRTPGSESAEIVATHASTAPTGTTVTLASTLVRAHPRGTIVYIIRANQVRFFHSATEVDANSDDSSLSALAAAQNIDPTLIRNIYDDTAQTSGYYYFRFQDSINSVNLLYSAAIPWNIDTLQFAENEVGFILEFVRTKLDHDWDERFSKDTAMQEINACLRFIQGKLKRFASYLVPDYVLGQTRRGVFEYDLPADIYDPDTNKSILQVRLSRAYRPLTMLDEKEFDRLLDDVAHTKVRTQPSVGAVTLEIDNSYDFDDDGTVHVYTSNTLDEISYTGVTRSATAGVLTGVPGSGDSSIEAAHAVDTDVWQGEQEGEPRYGNVRDGKLRIWPLASAQFVNRNIEMDYYEEVQKVDSENDTIDVRRYDMVKYWLLWQGKAYWRNDGKADAQDSDYLLFAGILRDMIRTHLSGQKFKMIPSINRIDYRGGKRGGRFDTT